ncbi:hypothetical protein TcWFU_010521 [Taenia crassiceps]|uniref:Uncharacterized protein n=1 Tax=Taenia crassiceps TaxID=6207 RepID=A0ABR4Q5Z9_9CEST
MGTKNFRKVIIDLIAEGAKLTQPQSNSYWIAKFLAEKGCQFDLLGNNCSQNSRDSAIDSSQSDKVEHNESVRRISKLPIKFCDTAAVVPTPRKTGLQFGGQCKPNVRWRRRSNLVREHHVGVCNSPSHSPIFSDPSIGVAQDLLQSLGPMGDIFCDPTKESRDDDESSSISDDCISLGALLDIEQ